VAATSALLDALESRLPADDLVDLLEGIFSEESDAPLVLWV
jgi:hypothetical protein